MDHPASAIVYTWWESRLGFLSGELGVVHTKMQGYQRKPVSFESAIGWEPKAFVFFERAAKDPEHRPYRF